MPSLLVVKARLEGDAASIFAAGDVPSDLVVIVGWVSLHDVKYGGAGNVLEREMATDPYSNIKKYGHLQIFFNF